MYCQKNALIGTLCKGLLLNKCMKRPLCPVCNQRPRAINYYKEGIAHYRSRCETCTKKNKKLKTPTPRWSIRGYKKKMSCDVCNFKARYSSQTVVYHIDGNLNNAELPNLRSVCRNCIEAVARSDLTWRRGDLAPDF